MMQPPRPECILNLNDAAVKQVHPLKTVRRRTEAVQSGWLLARRAQSAFAVSGFRCLSRKVSIAP
jgi:hypothetical protein